MALSTATISFDLADYAGTDFDSRRLKVWATTNVEGETVIDTVGNAIRLGSGNATVNSDGTGTLVVWVPGTGSNPDTWQTYVHASYPDRHSAQGRVTRTFGPFTITADANLADLVEEQEVPPTYITTVTTLLDGYVTEAEGYADAAAASAADAVDISGISTSDGVVSALVAGTAGAGSSTRAAITERERLFHPEDYGAVGNGTTDDTAAINAVLSAILTAGSGTLVLPKMYRCNGAIAPTYTGGPSNPVQKPIRITSPGAATSNGRWISNPRNGGGGLDLRYDGTDGLHPAKFDTRGAGMLEIDHISIISGGTDNFPMFQTTLTTAHIHHNFIQGNTANSGVACVQDFAFLGGSGTTTTDAATSAFQGYGTHIHDNFFDHIRRGVVGQSYCNSVAVTHNTFSVTCGNAGTGSGTVALGTVNHGAAIEFNGNATAGFNVGNITYGNTIEVVNYKYGIASSWGTRNQFGPDGIWDPGAIYVAAHYFDASAQHNHVRDGYSDDNYPKALDSGLSNRVDQSAQARFSFRAQPQFFKGVVPDQTFVGGIGNQTLAASGDAGGVKIGAGAAGSPSYPEIILTTNAAQTITDLATTNGSATVTSATAAFTRQHERAPIKGTGIPTNTIILRYISATSVQLSANATATATGVTAQIGRGTTGGGTDTEEVGFNRRHLQARGSSPSVSVHANAGTGASASLGHNPTDMGYQLTLITGTSPAAGQLVTVGQSLTWNNFPKIVFSPANAAAAAAMVTAQFWGDGSTRANWFLHCVAAPPASTTLIFDVVALS